VFRSERFAIDGERSREQSLGGAIVLFRHIKSANVGERGRIAWIIRAAKLAPERQSPIVKRVRFARPVGSRT
jgi:hypothetical protein